MSYNSQIPDQQGAVKSSEIFTDQQLEIIKNNVGDTVLASLQGMMKPISDAVRYNNFVLHSTGQMFWQNTLGTTSIKFDSDSRANNIVLTLYVMDESAVSRTVDVIVPGTTGSNSLTAFNSITLAANELVYLEISRANLLAATSGTPSSTPGQLILENGITGGSTASGKRVLKTTLTGTAGMPAMIADMNSLTQSNSQTVNIPLAVRYDWTDGLTTFPDLWWIPHGIRWPSNVRSVVGAVVVSGFEALPNYFVRSELELTQALTALSSDGGIIVPTQSFSITGAITVPPNVTIMGRSSKYNGINNAKITVTNGSGFVLQSNASLTNLPIIVQAAFGSSGVANVVSLSASGSSVSNCEFSLLSTTPLNLGNTRCVTINASYCKVQENFFTSSVAGATAIYFTTGFTNNLVTFTRVSNITENAYQDRGRSVGTRSDYGMVPVGSIIPWLGASYINGSNGSPSYLVGGSGVANLTTYLGDGWVICDGRSLPTDSVLNIGGNTFTPNLTDLYLLGSSTFGGSGGNNTYTSTGTTASFNGVAVGVNAVNAAVTVDAHSHDMKHVHAWSTGSYANSGNAAGDSARKVTTHFNISSGMSSDVAGNYIIGSSPKVSTNIANWWFPQNFETAQPGIPFGRTNQNSVFLHAGNTAGGTVSPNGNLYTGSPVSNAGQKNNTGNTSTTGNAFVSGQNINTSSLNSAQGNHTHTINSVFPSYLSVIYIMRIK